MPQLGEETFAKKLTTTAGGGAFITAATISALDQEVSLLATLPAAPFDQIVKTEMAAVGISPELCQSAPNGEGARALTAGDWHHQPGIPTEVIDTTGAGDSFNGGFIVSWLSGLPLPACLAKGNQCGAASVSGVGGTCGVQTLRSRLAV